MWPRLSAHEFLHDLFGARPLLAAAGKGTLTPAEVQRLYRPRSTSLDAVPWTVGDAALIDEARTLLGPRRSRPARVAGAAGRGGDGPRNGILAAGTGGLAVPSASALSGLEDDIRSFGHIVVDEVQDLSPMQLRMLARRSLSGSMTVVGDIAQATGPWAPAGWDDITRHLSPQRKPTLVEFTVSYRTPAEVVALASKVLGGRRPRHLATAARSTVRRDAAPHPDVSECPARAPWRRWRARSWPRWLRAAWRCSVPL